ncbi:MAG: hypothetical protein M1419_03650 [Bacteroidetes bacterium]|nr:hypothetical protein [Bacteroidota bacterium]
MKLFISAYFLIIISNSFLYSQEIDGKYDFTFYPKPIPEFSLKSSIGVTVGKLPKFIVDDQINQIPMLFFYGRFGLPLNISANAGINTNVLTNHFSAGASWHFDIGKLSFSIGDNMAFWYGFAYFDYFNSKIYGWINYPSVAIGFNFGELRATLKNEAAYMLHLTKSIGNIAVQTQKDRVINISSSLILEQPLWDENIFALGIKFNYTRYFYQSWLAYTTNQVWLIIPEFMVGYNI